MRFAVILLLLPLLAGASSVPKKPAHKPVKKSAATKKKSAHFSPRQTQPDAQRSREIQDALHRAGYLPGTPSGKWDAATSAAFAKYQQDHGRKATGKPDALSLKELGLGPKYDNLVTPSPSTGPPRAE